MSSLKRILLLCPNLENNGPTFNTLAMAEALKKVGFSILTLALAGGEREHAFAANGLEMLIDSHIRCWLRGRDARSRIAAFAPQVIHVMDFGAAPAGRYLSLRLAVPLVITANRSLEQGQYKLKYFKQAKIVAVSDAVLMTVVKTMKLARDSIRVIHNGLDLDRYFIPREKLELGTSVAVNGGERKHIPVVGTFGSLLPHKGQKIFLQAAALVLQKWPRVEFIIIGSGPDQKSLRQFAFEQGVVKRVTFSTGSSGTTSSAKLADKQEAQFLRQIDIFVEPALQEGLGLSVMQAMAWARPVVASGVGGLYSLVEDGVTGILVPKQNPEAMAEAIEKLLAEPLNAEEMGLRGRERIAAEFAINEVAKQHLELYRECFEKTPGDA